jgi:PEP-CTERM motif
VTSVERAKKFMQSKSRTIAMVAVPLASLVTVAIPAKAGVVVNSFGCFVGSSGGNAFSGSCATSPFPSGSNNFTGVSIFGSGSSFLFSGGSLVDISFNVSGSAIGDTGPSGGLIPVTWNFNVNTIGEGQAFWTIDIPTFGFFQSGSTFGGNVSGSGSFFVSGSYNDVFIAFVDVNQFASGSGELDLLVPAGLTVDINPAQSGVPEPGTFGLLGGALGGLALLRRRKKA